MITIDGPAGAGKSTVAKMLAKRLGFYLLDTGAIYRCLALLAKRKNVSYTDEVHLKELAKDLPICFQRERGFVRVFLGTEEVTQEIRSPEISEGASLVSPYAAVREALLPIQRDLAGKGSCVVEGRDVGTVVLPHAPLKFFLTARPEVRAQRRLEEIKSAGVEMTLAQILQEQTTRDGRDSERSVAPLKRPEDAVLIDTSDLTLEQVVNQMERIYKERLRSFP